MTLRKLLDELREKYPDKMERILDYSISCDTMTDEERDYIVSHKDKEIRFFDFQY